MKWFPELAIEQIRENVKFSTFLVETLPPDDNWDVELRDGRVTGWRSFNHSRDGKMILRPINVVKTRGSVLKKLTPPLMVHQRYGLKFERKEQSIYTSNTASVFLRNIGVTTVLTMTFLVGVLPPNEIVSTTTGEEEFLLNDYQPEEKTPDNIRGISIVSNEEEKFDLYLHGASASSNTANRLKIGVGLKTSWFYTLQVKWGAQIKRADGSVRHLDSSFAIYENKKRLVESPFQPPLLRDVVIPAFSLGGKKTSNGTDNCFTGILSNVEILQSDYETIPKELLHFIVLKQSLINDDWLQAPALKRKKIT